MSALPQLALDRANRRAEARGRQAPDLRVGDRLVSFKEVYQGWRDGLSDRARRTFAERREEVFDAFKAGIDRGVVPAYAAGGRRPEWLGRADAPPDAALGSVQDFYVPASEVLRVAREAKLDLTGRGIGRMVYGDLWSPLQTSIGRAQDYAPELAQGYMARFNGPQGPATGPRPRAHPAAAGLRRAG